MNIQSFIFVHDQDILLEKIKSNVFSCLENVIYVFVGNKDVNKIENYSNVIICRNLPQNIENYPKLTSFTGWYALWKNNLINSDYINLFEYDIDISENFNMLFFEEFIKDNEIIGYIPYNVHSPSFLGHPEVSEDLVKSISKNYHIDSYNYVKSLPQNVLCSLTSNHTFSRKAFIHYMNWVEPLIDDIKNSPKAGHQIERSIPLFYILNNIKTIIVPNILHHYQLNSHKT